MFDHSFWTLRADTGFYVIICYAPVAIVIQSFIDASDFVFLLIINRYFSH